MDKEFVPYEPSLDMKELGFDEPCFGYFNTTSHLGIGSFVFKECDKNTIDGYGNKPLLRPTFSQAFRWFREKYELRNSITDFIDDKTGIEWDYEIAIIGTDLDEKGNYNPLVDYSTDDETRKFKTYEESELACLVKLIEIIKNK